MESAKIEIQKLCGPDAKKDRKVCSDLFKKAQADHASRVEAIRKDRTLSDQDQEDQIKASEAKRASDKLAASTALATARGLAASGDITAALATSAEAAYIQKDQGTLDFCNAWAQVLAPWLKGKHRGDGQVKGLAGGLHGASKARTKLSKEGRMDGFLFKIGEAAFEVV